MLKRAALGVGVLVLASWFAGPPAFAIYQWYDEQGNLHITDYPKPSGKAEKAEPEERSVPAPAPAPAQQPVSAPAPQPTPVLPLQPAQPGSPGVKGTAVPLSAVSATIRTGATPTSPLSQPTPTAVAQSLATQTAPTPTTAAPAPARQMPARPAAVEPGAGLAAVLAGFLLVILGVLAGLYLYASLCLFLIAQKLEVTPAWTAWVPLANLWTFVSCARMPVWWIVLLFVPFVNAVAGTYLWICITGNLGRNRWLGLLMLLPVVNLIWMGVLAFSRKE